MIPYLTGAGEGEPARRHSSTSATTATSWRCGWATGSSIWRSSAPTRCEQWAEPFVQAAGAARSSTCVAIRSSGPTTTRTPTGTGWSITCLSCTRCRRWWRGRSRTSPSSRRARSRRRSTWTRCMAQVSRPTSHVRRRAGTGLHGTQGDARTGMPSRREVRARSTSGIPIRRPSTTSRATASLWHDRQRRRADFHLVLAGTSPIATTSRILVAGCGTSQAAKHALRWPTARGDRHRLQRDQHRATPKS